MRGVDRFNTKQFYRAHRNSKIIYHFSKYGSKGLSKVNPTLVFIDAVVSLGEMFVSYANYREVKEQNIQLEIEIRTLKKELANFKKSLELEDRKLQEMIKYNETILEKKIKENQQISRMLDINYNQAKKYFLMMKNEVTKYQSKFPHSKESKEITKQYNVALTSYIQTTLVVIGG